MFVIKEVPELSNKQCCGLCVAVGSRFLISHCDKKNTAAFPPTCGGRSNRPRMGSMLCLRPKLKFLIETTTI